MYYAFMGQCLAVAAYLPIDSLNSPYATKGGSIDDGEALDRVEDPTALHEERMHAAMMAVQAREFVAVLPPRLSEIAKRHYWNGQTQVEIALALGITQSAIAHALARITKLGRAYFGVVEH